MTRLTLVLPAALACSTAQAPHLDGGATDAARDARVDAAGGDAPADAAGPYRRTITIDGVDDFVAAEQFPTTSTGYAARVTWDAQHVYVGYRGPDLDPAALDAQHKWLFVYVDVDPGATPTGATQGQTYNTQTATFPAGFGAEYYARWKCDTTLATIERHAGGGTWTTSPTAPITGHAGNFVELAIPRSVLGASTQLGIVAFMINEKPQFEGSFAGLFAGNFTDGYAATLPLTKFLRADLTAARAPNDPANVAP